MMRRLIFALLSAVTLGATEIRTYRLLVDCASDGTATIEGRLELAACAPGVFAFPVGLAVLEDLSLSQAPPEARLHSHQSHGLTTLRLELPVNVQSSTDIVFTGRVQSPYQAIQVAVGEKTTLPAANHLFRHAFFNTLETPIGTYVMEVRFPQNMRVHAIREQLPKPRKGEAGPRVRLDRAQGREGAQLQISGLKQGESTSLVLETTPHARSYAWLCIGLALSALYLFAFRDLIPRHRT